MSSKVKHGDKNVKYFTGYVDSDVVKSLSIFTSIEWLYNVL